MAIKTIIYGKEITTKEQKKFPVFSANINGKYFSVKFTQDCDRSPKKAGVYRLQAEDWQYSIQKGKSYISKDGELKDGNPIIWIKNCVIEPLTQDELDAITAERNKNFFDSYSSNENENEERPL